MIVKYGKTLSAEEVSVANEISETCGVSFDVARLLLYRNINTVKAAERFLSPSKKWFYDPFSMSGMREAVERLFSARIKDETVLVFGDYDADGICAATVLSGCLKEFGLNVVSVVPERENGYGLNLEIIDAVREERKIDLIVTVDCGISDREKVEEIKKRSIDVIVTDHHEPPEILPLCVCINPKIEGQEYPFNGLCGAGVAYKLGYALIGEKADEFLDLVATATVADSMDLIDENRDIVSEGLKLMNGAKKRTALKYLLGDSGKEVTSQSLAYIVAPRINAGGRQGDASCALKLFGETEPKKIYDLAVKLNEYNIARQNDCEAVYEAANAIIREERLYKDDVILVKGESWHSGVLGIVAAKLCENYGKPVVVFAKFKDFYKGSGRSVEGINIFEALSQVKGYLKEFGGHSQAVGLSIQPENFSEFKEALNGYFRDNVKGASGEKEIFVDFNADCRIPVEFAKEIEKLAPFGVGNRRPLFSTEVIAVDPKPIKFGSPHYSFETVACEMMDFNGESDVELLAYQIPKTLIFELNYSVFRGKESLKGYLRNVFLDEKEAYESIISKIREGKISGVSSSRAAFVSAFNVIRENANKPFSDPVNFYFSVKPDIGVKQFVLCFAVFSELGFFTVENDKLAINGEVKNDLNNSTLYRAVKERGL